MKIREIFSVGCFVLLSLTGKAETVSNYVGQVGTQEANVTLRWKDDSSVEGSYICPNGKAVRYQLRGVNSGPGQLQLEEYTNSRLTAHIELIKTVIGDAVEWSGLMKNLDGRVLKVSFTRSLDEPAQMTNDSQVESRANSAVSNFEVNRSSAPLVKRETSATSTNPSFSTPNRPSGSESQRALPNSGVAQRRTQSTPVTPPQPPPAPASGPLTYIRTTGKSFSVECGVDSNPSMREPFAFIRWKTGAVFAGMASPTTGSVDVTGWDGGGVLRTYRLSHNFGAPDTDRGFWVGGLRSVQIVGEAAPPQEDFSVKGVSQLGADWATQARADCSITGSDRRYTRCSTTISVSDELLRKYRFVSVLVTVKGYDNLGKEKTFEDRIPVASAGRRTSPGFYNGGMESITIAIYDTSGKLIQPY